MHPPETLAVLSALRAVVAAYSLVLDATLVAHANLAGPSDACECATPKEASCTANVATGTLIEANNGSVEDNSKTGHRRCSNAAAGETTEATRALAHAMGAYTVAMHRVLGESDYKMFLKPPPL